jgi:tetratricopeptide (TPR) repeat protein
VNEEDYVGCPNEHYAHRDCIKDWFIKQSTCPICYEKYDQSIIDSFQAYTQQAVADKKAKAEAERLRKEEEKNAPVAPKTDAEMNKVFQQAEDFLLEENYKEAIKTYWGYLDAHPKFAPDDFRILQTTFALGIAYYKMGKFDLSIQQLTKIVKADPQYPRAFEFLEVCYEKVGMHDKAKWARERIAIARAAPAEISNEEPEKESLESKARIATVKKTKDGNVVDETVAKDFNAKNVFFAKKTTSQIRAPTPSPEVLKPVAPAADKFAERMADIKAKSSNLEKKMAEKNIKTDIKSVASEKAKPPKKEKAEPPKKEKAEPPKKEKAESKQPAKAGAKTPAKADVKGTPKSKGKAASEIDIDSLLNETSASPKSEPSKSKSGEKDNLGFITPLQASSPPKVPPKSAPPMAPPNLKAPPMAPPNLKAPPMAPPNLKAPGTASPKPSAPIFPAKSKTPQKPVEEPSISLDFSALDENVDSLNLEPKDESQNETEGFSTDIPQNNMFFGNIPVNRSPPPSEPENLPSEPSEEPNTSVQVDEDYMAQLEREMEQKFSQPNPDQQDFGSPTMENETSTPGISVTPHQGALNSALVKKCIALQLNPRMQLEEIDQKAQEVMYQISNIDNMATELSDALSNGQIDENQFNEQDAQMKSYLKNLNEMLDVLKALRETYMI